MLTPARPVHVRHITLLCIVGFENNFAQMIIMIRQCVANKSRVGRLYRPRSQSAIKLCA